MAAYIDSQKLIHDFRSCNKTAFEAVYNEYFSGIYAFCFNLVRDKEEARDIASDTFMKLFKLYDRFENLVNMRAFLYTTSRNACMDYFRAEKRKAQARLYIVKAQPEDEYTRINDELDGIYYKALKNSVSKLPDRQKQAIEKLFWEELDYKEAAQQMDTSVENLYKIRNRAIGLLRELLRSQKIQEGTITFFLLFYSICS
jgi:RNA polymerase sigma factor (sigma-70 family)